MVAGVWPAWQRMENEGRCIFWSRRDHRPQLVGQHQQCLRAFSLDELSQEERIHPGSTQERGAGKLRIREQGWIPS